MKPLVQNAADENQIKSAKQKEKLRRDRELDDLKFVLAHPQGRRTIWRFLEKAGVFKSVWESSAKIHYNSGQQDFGHFLQAEIIEADQESYFTMMREAQKSKEIENV